MNDMEKLAEIVQSLTQCYANLAAVSLVGDEAITLHRAEDDLCSAISWIHTIIDKRNMKRGTREDLLSKLSLS